MCEQLHPSVNGEGIVTQKLQEAMIILLFFFLLEVLCHVLLFFRYSAMDKHLHVISLKKYQKNTVMRM